MVQSYNYMVATECMTYNHSSYIEQTLHGFEIQEVPFPVAFCIVDDASTDGEQDILRSWAEVNLQLSDGEETGKQMPYGKLYLGKHVNNPNVLFVIILLEENHYGKRPKSPYIEKWIKSAKYHAMCEGDDYWVHPQKLKMQVDFMETHSEYVMCHTDFSLSDGRYRNSGSYNTPDDDYFEINIRYGVDVGTLTSLYRTEVYDIIPKFWTINHWIIGDYPMWIEMSHEGKIKYIPVITACYRVLEESASHGTFEKEVRFANTALEIRRFYSNYYGVELYNDGYSKGYFLSLMKKAYKHNRPEAAREFYSKAKQMKLLSPKTRIIFLAIVFKPFGWLMKRFYIV